MPSNHQQECVGTLLVDSKDLQELSDAPGLLSNVQKRFTGGEGDSQHVVEVNKKPAGGLTKRITERLQGPAPPIEDTEDLDA